MQKERGTDAGKMLRSACLQREIQAVIAGKLRS